MTIGSPMFAFSMGFRSQLVFIFTVGLVVLAMASSLVTSRLSSHTVSENLIAQGYQVTKNFAAEVTLALLYGSADNAKDPARSLLAFPEVKGVAVYDPDQRVLFAAGQETVPHRGTKRWPMQLSWDSESANAWYFVAPVYIRRTAGETESSPFEAEVRASEHIGFVRVVVGKNMPSSGKSVGELWFR